MCAVLPLFSFIFLHFCIFYFCVINIFEKKDHFADGIKNFFSPLPLHKVIDVTLTIIFYSLRQPIVTIALPHANDFFFVLLIHHAHSVLFIFLQTFAIFFANL